MGMFTRINDIIQSNINALLDKAEDPEKMIRLIIQEMQETLVEIRSLAANHLAEQKTLNRQVEALEKQAQHWQENAELAVSKVKMIWPALRWSRNKVSKRRRRLWKSN